MIRHSILAAVAAAALVGAAVAQMGQPGREGMPMGGKMMGMADTKDATSSNPDRAFAAVVISHARLQRHANELVAEKATNPEIKQLAKSISDEYQELSAKVQKAAKEAGITIDQDRMLPRDQAIFDHLKQLPVAALQRDYVFFEAGANQTQLLFAQWAAKAAEKPEMKQAASAISEKLQERGKKIDELAQAEINNGGRGRTATGD